MGEGFKKFVESGTDSTYVPRGTRCGVCGKKFGFFATGFWSTNTKQLADGPVCSKCYEQTEKLIKTKRQWMGKELLKSEEWKGISGRNWREITIEQAKKLPELKDQSDRQLLSGYGEDAGGWFKVEEAFQIEPTKLQVGIVRAKQLQNKTVVYGTVEEGQFEKGDTVKVDSEGMILESSVIEAYMQDEDISTFQEVLQANLGKQRIKEGQTGWLILELETGLFPGDKVIKID